MIRVNLLPHTREQRGTSEGGQLWLLAVVGVVVLETVGLFFFHQTKQDELDSIQQNATTLEADIAKIKSLVKDHQTVKDALAVLRAREDAIARLQQGRKGPTAVLLELSRILTTGKGPTLDPRAGKPSEDGPVSLYNPGWDSRRVWITRYEEADKSVRLEGLARDGSDVYEFAQRLKMSVFFSDVQLLPGKQKSEKDTKVDVVDFALQVKANY